MIRSWHELERSLKNLNKDLAKILRQNLLRSYKEGFYKLEKSYDHATLFCIYKEDKNTTIIVWLSKTNYDIININ